MAGQDTKCFIGKDYVCRFNGTRVLYLHTSRELSFEFIRYQGSTKTGQGYAIH